MEAACALNGKDSPERGEGDQNAAQHKPTPIAMDADEMELERLHFLRILNAFRHYKSNSLQRIRRSEKYFSTLSERHQRLLVKYQTHLSDLRVAIEHNAQVIRVITKDAAHLFENVDHTHSCDSKGDAKIKETPSNMDMEKVQSTVKQIARDWSVVGQKERDACYGPILSQLQLLFPEYGDRRSISVLVPGAGLGRLAFEIAKMGFACQGNEFSLFMLFASNFILNRCQGTHLFTLYPWVHQFCNNRDTSDQVTSITFPDVDPSDLPKNSQFSMAAGDFLQVYIEPDSWDCIVTCFFLDTANNVVAYIDQILFLLKPGGYWINLGPLLYHFADVPNENSIEPAYDVLRDIITNVGFDFLKEDPRVKTTYSHNPLSMLKYEYESIFFVCQKPLTKSKSR